MNISMWRYRERSKSFLYRVKWFSEINLFELKKNFSLNNVIIKLIRIFNVLKFNVYIRILGNKLIFPFFKKYYIDKIEVLEKLQKKILEVKPNLVIFPTQSQTKADYDLVRICKKNKIKTFFIIDNWDNLSDKSIMLYKPDYLGVWGQQTKKHAIQIQKFKSKFIFNLGTPRFEMYFRRRNKQNKNFFKFKYILFLGTALEFDEFKILKKINYLISKNLTKKIKLFDYLII